MLKTKLTHPKNKPHQKAKTLESFCQYQSNRFNQATFQHKFSPDQQKLLLPLSQTDLKIQSIKKKYGIPSRNPHHQRYFSVSQNFTSSHPNSSHPKPALKERSLSNFANHVPETNKTHIPQNGLKISRNQQTKHSNNKQLRQQLKSSRVQNKENFTHQQLFLTQKTQPQKINQNIDYNDTFSKEGLQTISDEVKIQQDNKKEYKLFEKHLNKNQILQSRRSKKMNKTQQNFWSSSTYISRLQNIQKINGKIKSALQNFQGLQKRDISVSIGKRKLQKTAEPIIQVNKSNLQNDLIETRILQNVPCHHRKASNLTGTSPASHSVKSKTENDKNSSYGRFKTVNNFNPIKQTKNDDKKMPNNEDNLFSRIKSLYKRSEEIQEKKAEIMNYQQRPKSVNQPSRNEYSTNSNQQLRSSSLTSEKKLQKLQEIKNKYISKISCRSIYTQNEGQKTQHRLTTVRKNRSPEKPAFNLIHLKEDKSESYGDQIQDFDQNQDKVNELYASQLEQIITLTKSGIQTRKKTKEAQSQLIANPNHSPQSTNQIFCSQLKKQIQFDQNFRKVKYWFKYQTKGLKWDQLNKQYHKLVKRLSQSQKSTNNLEEKFQLNFLTKSPVQSHLLNFQMLDEEIDPFFSLRVCQFTYSDLLQSYLESEMNWNDIGRFGIFSKLIQENWIIQVDSDKKGYANLTDLTRFMNFNSQSFFKNRDLALIFKRLTSDEPKEVRKENKLNVSQTLNFQKITETLNLGVSHKRITSESLRRIEVQFSMEA